jgi:hypothetical protein
VCARLRESLVRRFLACGASLTFLDLDLVSVKERALTVAPIPSWESTVKIKATNSPNTEKRFLKITGCFPIPDSDTDMDARDWPSYPKRRPVLAILRY